MNSNILRKKLFLSMIKWLQTVNNVRNAEEIQLAKTYQMWDQMR
jgi:hypothetical protein